MVNNQAKSQKMAKSIYKHQSYIERNNASKSASPPPEGLKVHPAVTYGRNRLQLIITALISLLSLPQTALGINTVDLTKQILYRRDSKEVRFSDLKFSRDITSKFSMTVSPPFSDPMNPPLNTTIFQPYSILNQEPHYLIGNTTGCTVGKSLDAFRMVNFCKDPVKGNKTIIGTSFYHREPSIFAYKIIPGYDSFLICDIVFEENIMDIFPDRPPLTLSKQFIYCRRDPSAPSTDGPNILARFIITERFFEQTDILDVVMGNWTFTKTLDIDMENVGWTFLPKNVTKLIFNNQTLDKTIGMVCFYFRKVYQGPMECAGCSHISSSSQTALTKNQSLSQNPF